MAKVKGPLMSMRASGQLGKTLVFSRWKGEPTVRQHVVPANPNTGGQQAVRNNFKAGVLEWHTAGYNAIDRTAWNTFAGTYSDPRSGFNQMVAEFRACMEAGNVWSRLATAVINTGTTKQIVLVLASLEDATTVGYIGTSPTYMPTSQAAVSSGGDTVQTITFTGLTTGVKYYFYAKQTLGGKGGRTGVYSATAT